MKLLIIPIILFAATLHASVTDAEKAYFQRGSSASKFGNIANELADAGYFYSAIPFFKEYIIRAGSSSGSKYEKNLNKVIHKTGIKSFEIMPAKYLARSKGHTVSYILAKKYFLKGNYSKALSYARKVRADEGSYPYIVNILASIESIKGNFVKANELYEKCVDESDAWLKEYKSKQRRKELKANRDYCIVGLARSKFAAKKYDQADLAYLDLDKTSGIWPEIILEEAWNSYYQKNYNRSLGKLVTYKAPLLSYNFYPEAYVLEAMSYLKLCLYNDAKSTANNFYKKYKKDAAKMKSFLLRNGNNNKAFFDALNKGTGNKLINRFIKRTRKDIAMKQMISSQNQMVKELDRVSASISGRFGAALRETLRQTVKSHNRMIGAYTKSRLRQGYMELVQVFSGMSYLKLEILRMKKKKLYSGPSEDDNGKRGDIKYVPRNEKQYFWDFNGEFWADEIGDYVFALKSEC